ncbi:GNAT family N-acetyltransferase [Micromonospora sp. NPDC000089]|uniref:GNAT family N-acetyltransferase n=1 Tax=unclassified Micromonospora TaxID=2617518 RepID=UPI0036BBB96D
MLIESRPAVDPEIGALVVAQQRELRQVDARRGGPGPLAHDEVDYLAVVVAGRAVACGGLLGLDADTGELKRMYVRPAFRGRGIGRHLLGALEELAFQRGHSVLRLRTGAYLPAAIGLYTSCGYQPIPAYGEHDGDPSGVCLAKRLPVAA